MTKSKFFAPMLPTWERMRTNQHPWLDVIFGNAKLSLYSDSGRWAALSYAITDDISYAQSAWTKWKGTGTIPKVLTSGDNTREMFIEWCMLYDLLRPYMDTIGVTASVASVLRAIADRIIAGTIINDSDQTASSYLGLAMTDAVLAHDPQHAPYLTRQWKNTATGKLIPVGGLVSTGANRDTIRNVLSLYVKMAEGGNWIESSMYDASTTWLIDMGTTFLNNFHGQDYFPEVTAFRDAHRRMFLHSFHPSIKDTFQYGDEQQPNIMRPIDFESVFSALGHLPGDEELKAAVRGCEASVRATHTWPIKTGSVPTYARYFYFADPYQGADDTWRGKALKAHFSPGQGHIYSGRANTAMHFTFGTMKEVIEVDHFGAIPFGDIQVVKGQDRAIYHPIGYGPEERAYNQPIVMNRQASHESTEILAFDEGADYLYGAGVSAGAGPDIVPGFYKPPPPYLHEWSRSFVKLDDIIIVHDRLKAENPFEQVLSDGTTKAITLYYPGPQARMAKRRGLKSILWHMPVTPTVSGRNVSWSVGNVNPRIELITPNDLAIEVVDTSSTEFAMNSYIFPSQLKWAVICTPPDRLFDSIVWGVDLSGGATFEPYVDPDGMLTGVKVLRQGQPDALVLFSAVQGPKMSNTFVGGVLTFDRTKARQVFNARLLSSEQLPKIECPDGTRLYLADVLAGAVVQVNEKTFTASTPDKLLAITAVVDEPPPPPDTDPIDEVEMLKADIALLKDEIAALKAADVKHTDDLAVQVTRIDAHATEIATLLTRSVDDAKLIDDARRAAEKCDSEIDTIREHLRITP